MEHKRLFLSAIGVGVGVGLGLISGQTVSKCLTGNVQNANGRGADGITGDQIEQELLRLIVDGKACPISFEDFPYFLSERTKELVKSAAYVHLRHMDVSRHTRYLSYASRAILLSGPTELYLQTLAKALTHHFEAKLLLLDISDFSNKLQSKYGEIKRDSTFKRSTSESTLERMSSMFGSLPGLQSREEYGTSSKNTRGIESKWRNPEDEGLSLKIRRNISVSSYMSSNSGWIFDENVFLQSLYKVLVSVSETNCIILYVRDIDKHLLQSTRLCKLFDQMLKRLTGSILVLGSRILDVDNDYGLDEKISLLFPYNIEIRAPDDESHLVSWKAQLEEDLKKIQIQDNKNHIAEVLAANDLECNELGSICQADTMVLSNYIEEIVVSAVYYHLMHNKDPEYRNGKLVISSDSLAHGLNIFPERKGCTRDAIKLKTKSQLTKENKENPNEVSFPLLTNDEESSTTKKDGGEIPSTSKASEMTPDNEFEKKIRPEVIPANEIGVTFADIGALDDTKESLQELVVLPIRRPDLFQGGLLKPCRGILLFGPPGTGKTMMAKAIANEAGASFINVSMSTIASKWFGEDEKNVRALFTLASKVSPSIIFVDEADSILGQKTLAGEQEVIGKIKNEFMTHWDGLMTKPSEPILVLAATNRPFDLDEAIIRRFERRIMFGLPSVESREKILKTLLLKEKAEDIDFKELASMTSGYSGSDLKNLCVTAAYRPVRELLQQEMHKDKNKKKIIDDDLNSEEGNMEERVIALRSLNMEDMREAKTQVAASFTSEGAMKQLNEWNELYGKGGSRKKEQFSYFL